MNFDFAIFKRTRVESSYLHKFCNSLHMFRCMVSISWSKLSMVEFNVVSSVYNMQLKLSVHFTILLI